MTLEPAVRTARGERQIWAGRRTPGEPGYDTDDGGLGFGGWVWRYDLTPVGPSETRVTLSYDWSAVPDVIRQHIGFPPFPVEHLDNSLDHLAELVSL